MERRLLAMDSSYLFTVSGGSRLSARVLIPVRKGRWANIHRGLFRAEDATEHRTGTSDAP